MSARQPDVLDGLAVASLRGEGKLWEVIHAASGLPVFSGGYLRQRRFAEQARADFLATGVDFTADSRTVYSQRERWRAPYALWRFRSHQDEIDPVTGEHYSSSTHYGQVIPSAAQAAAYRARRAEEAEYAAQLAAWETDGGA